jgi:hypothetical protein
MKNGILLIYKIALFSILLCFISLSLCAQTDTQKTASHFWNNVRFGGGIGLSFGDGFFSGTLAPSAIYQFSDQLAAGIGLNGTYSNRKDVFKSTIIGGSVLALFNPIREIQLSSEFEELHVNRNFDENFVSNADDKYWYPAFFLGVGYRTGNVTFGVRYDVLYDEEKSIYADPWMPFVRVYF